jgi:hypothetical protein
VLLQKRSPARRVQCHLHEVRHASASTTSTKEIPSHYILVGRLREAEGLFRHVLSFQNDVGLFAEQLDSNTGEQLGNFPQGFTHIALINTAARLKLAAEGRKPVPHAILEDLGPAFVD